MYKERVIDSELYHDYGVAPQSHDTDSSFDMGVFLERLGSMEIGTADPTGLVYRFVDH